MSVPDEGFGSYGVNAYDCRACGSTTWVMHRDRGVTPSQLLCRATEGCDGWALSRWYRVPPGHPEPTHEWYRPEKAWVRRYDRRYPGSLQHYENGGLFLRVIGEEHHRGPEERHGPTSKVNMPLLASVQSTVTDGYRLRFLGDPVLKTAALPVKRVEDLPPDLVPAMKRILAEQKGIGLAAQQVGSLYRVALAHLGDELVVAINLEVVERSAETIISPQEGCLSVQSPAGKTFRTSVRRHEWARIRYLDEAGEEQDRRLEGFDAIVAQHEADHLDGRCIVDGLSRQQRRQAERMVGVRHG